MSGSALPEASIYARAVTPRMQRIRLAMFLAWLLVVALACYCHVVWRDEVRALSIALQGNSAVEMVAGLGDGHPAVWYLLLRGAHAIVGVPQVLQAVALCIAVAATLLVVLRSPFSLLVVALILLGRGAIYEYSVMARNYGISVLVLFLLATVYGFYRNRGIVIGALLFVLANCNVHSIILVGAFLLFWLLEILTDPASRTPAHLRTFAWNSAIALAGVLAAVATVYPPTNDAAAPLNAAAEVAPKALIALVLPAVSFRQLFEVGGGAVDVPGTVAGHLVYPVLESLVLFASLLGLRRRPAAAIAALAALLGLSAFFQLIYPGSYRHVGLWLAFLLSLYWIAARDAGGAPPSQRPANPDVMVRVGCVALLVLLGLQVPAGLIRAGFILGNIEPESSSRDFAQFIRAQSDLRQATIMADPDYLIEALPYYLPNPLYLPREQRFGSLAVFTRRFMQRITLRDILAQARTINATTGRPVVILLQQPLSATMPAAVFDEGYAWQLAITPQDVRAFQASTHFLQHFGPALSDETFDAYRLDAASADRSGG